MGNLCTKIECDENIFEGIIVEEIIPINPSEFHCDYQIKWNNKRKVFIYKNK